MLDLMADAVDHLGSMAQSMQGDREAQRLVVEAMGSTVSMEGTNLEEIVTPPLVPNTPVHQLKAEFRAMGGNKQTGVVDLGAGSTLFIYITDGKVKGVVVEGADGTDTAMVPA